MTTSYHTPLVNGQPATDATFNAPLGQLDQAIVNMIAGILPFANLSITGDLTVGDDLAVTGDAAITGAATFANDVTVGDNLEVADDVIVGGLMTVAETLTVNGNVSTGGTLASVGNITASAGLVNAALGLTMGNSAQTTLAGDAFTVTNTIHVLDTEGLAPTDQLVTINGGFQGRYLLVRNASNTRVITIRTTGNITTANGRDVVLDNPNVIVALVFSSLLNRWVEVGASPYTNRWLAVGLPAPTTQLVADTLTVTRSAMIIDTEALAATDQLSTINNGVDGQVILLQITNNARVITVRHGVGNIRTRRGTDFTMSNVNNVVVLVFNGSLWFEIAGDPGAILVRGSEEATPETVNQLIFPRASVIPGSSANERRLRLLPDVSVRDVTWARANAAALTGVGTANPTLTGTATSVAAPDGFYVNLAHAAATANTAIGWATPFTIFRRDYSPYARILHRTGPLAADVAGSRIMVGFTSATLTNVDVPVGHVALFRYSTAVADAGWVCVTNDGTTPTVTPTGIAVVENTAYTLEIQLDLTEVRFYINDVLVATHTTTLPAIGTNLGLQMIHWTLAAAIRQSRISRFIVTQD